MRPVFSVIEHLHRDRAVADDAVAGRFTCAGETVELGPEPDWWSAQLPADEEWRIDWVKFSCGLDLAHAYRTTGDARYRDAWERLVRSFLDQVPPGADPSDVTARRIVTGSAPGSASARSGTGSRSRWRSGSPPRRTEFAVHCRRPDGTIPALSDADSGDYDTLLELLGAPAGGEPLASFPDGGYFVQRSDGSRTRGS